MNQAQHIDVPCRRWKRVRIVMVQPTALDDRCRKLPSCQDSATRHGMVDTEQLFLRVANAPMLSFRGVDDSRVALGQTRVQGNLADVVQQAADESLAKRFRIPNVLSKHLGRTSNC